MAFPAAQSRQPEHGGKIGLLHHEGQPLPSQDFLWVLPFSEYFINVKDSQCLLTKVLAWHLQVLKGKQYKR